ncbi:two-component system response regulator [Thalassotalea loyana]|uniref:Two-component system response regulator n=1 Tax=Thalassotalea loyana TaxID=280483 RepID=A0ABQ6HBB3_9GAMM|nr:two-component system response regulator [Thalassotalea loyana]GLX83751.1 two-component system response regulator [Thalassotalea loyana]
MTTGLTHGTILVVDDNTENIDLLRGVLKEDYKILAAINGKSAIEIAKRKQPDMILLDIMMPGMSGYDVCKELKKDFSTCDIPIIFVTAMNEIQDEAKGLKLGAVDYITKPISTTIVKQRVRTHLALYDQTRLLESTVKERTKKLENSQLEIVYRLGRAAEYKDNETGMHVKRMSHYSRILALKAGMSTKDADMLLLAAPMHDIGKIGIPDSILRKPGKLDAQEWQVMKTHASIGAEILSSGGSVLLKMAETVALTHHEKYDGSGYPAGLKGKDIPLIGRIVAIADVFDALTSERPYKKAWSIEDAIALIVEERGKHFDPELADYFIESIDEITSVKEQFVETFDQDGYELLEN